MSERAVRAAERHALARTDRRVGRRVVRVIVSDAFEGTPFTGGLLRPYIVVPASAARLLDADELEAVLAHELAHVKRLDVALFVALGALGDVFWFLPFVRAVCQRVRELVERAADRDAVAQGATPARLARAIVGLASVATPAHAAFGGGSVRARVLALLGAERPRSLPVRAASALAAFSLATMAVASTFLGYV